MTDTARLLIDCKSSLGEGPFWHPARQQLFWFDINNQQLFAANAAGVVQGQWRFDEIVAAAAIIDSDTLALATETGLKRFDLNTNETAHLIDIEADVPANRTNDSRVHPSGAFWIGTMVKDEGPKNGAVYHYRAGELTRLIANAAIPNATCFSPDGTSPIGPTRRARRYSNARPIRLPACRWAIGPCLPTCPNIVAIRMAP